MTAAQRGELALSDTAAAASHADGRHDFGFIFGRWQVHNRKLADVADPGCTQWVTFGAVAHAGPIFGGLGHTDRIWAGAPAGDDLFEGFTPAAIRPTAQRLADLVGLQPAAWPPRPSSRRLLGTRPRHVLLRRHAG